MSLDDEVYSQPVQGKTLLLTEPAYAEAYSANRETDARTAVLRGLREYIDGLSYNAPGGTRMRFIQVGDAFPEVEQTAKYPAAYIYTDEPGVYDGAAFTPQLYTLPDGRTLQMSAEFTQNITIDLWCTNAPERMGLLAMLEDAFDPVEWMSGFRLRLPHYFNAVATFLKTTVTAVDSTENANRRWRLASLNLMATMPQIRMIGVLPGLDIRLQVETYEPDMSRTMTPPLEGVTAVDLGNIALGGD